MRCAAILIAAFAVSSPASAQQAGDWVGGGTPLSAYAMQPSQADPVNRPRTVRVARGQSLYDIATFYQIPMLALIAQNHLEPPYAVPPGTMIELPPANVHVVREGETLEDIARANNIDTHSLAVLNRLEPPYSLRPGDRLVLLGEGQGEQESYQQPSPMPASIEPTEPPAIESSGRFALPLRGAVVARFGAQMNGARLDGIEVSGSEGDAISAAADGDVVYAGSDLASYGTLVLVRHADNYVTAYGFARRALVREGQHVRAGQQIAELGPRPDGSARLLFQVRRGARAVDPAPLLGIAPN